jgi:hypothetical protein
MEIMTPHVELQEHAPVPAGDGFDGGGSAIPPAVAREHAPLNGDQADPVLQGVGRRHMGLCEANLLPAAGIDHVLVDDDDGASVCSVVTKGTSEMSACFPLDFDSWSYERKTAFLKTL